MRKQARSKMAKNTVPEGFSAALALVALVPVVFFGLSAVRAGSLLHSALFVAGAVMCLISGVVKVLWKGIAAVTRRNIWPMFVQMRVFMPAGFALIAAAGSAGGCWNAARNTTAFGRSQSTSRTRRPSAFTSTWAL